MDNSIETKTTRQRRTKITPPTPPGAFNWGKREFGIIAKSFEAETPELQNTMVAISGVLQLIKLNLSEVPDVISYLVRKQYPQLSEDEVMVMITKGLTGTMLANIAFGDTVPTTLPEILTSLASLTFELTDVQHNAFWDGMFKSIAAPLTQWEKVCVYAPYVYNVLVKPTVK